LVIHGQMSLSNSDAKAASVSSRRSGMSLPESAVRAIGSPRARARSCSSGSSSCPISRATSFSGRSICLRSRQLRSRSSAMPTTTGIGPRFVVGSSSLVASQRVALCEADRRQCVRPTGEWTDSLEFHFENERLRPPPVRRPHDGLDGRSRFHLLDQYVGCPENCLAPIWHLEFRMFEAIPATRLGCLRETYGRP